MSAAGSTAPSAGAATKPSAAKIWGGLRTSVHAPGAQEGYRFSKAMENPGFIGTADIRERYLPLGFSNFKLEGRGLGSALVLEFLLYYLTRPEYQIHVREAIYLDNMLDLF